MHSPPRSLCCLLMEGLSRIETTVATTGVPRSLEAPPSQDPTVRLHLGSYGDLRGGGLFRMNEVPLHVLPSKARELIGWGEVHGPLLGRKTISETPRIGQCVKSAYCSYFAGRTEEPNSLDRVLRVARKRQPCDGIRGVHFKTSFVQFYIVQPLSGPEGQTES